MHAEMWHERLRDEPRFRDAVTELWPYALGVVLPEQRAELAARVGLDEVEAVERGTYRRLVRRAAGRDDDGAALGAGGRAMVTEAQVWAALEEIPDPEIPVVSLVDLGVIRSVDVSNGHVHVEFTPTFLGCPALEFMKRAIEDKVPGARRRGRDRTTRGRPTRSPRRAARSCAPPASRRRRRGSCSCKRRCTAARTAARRTRRSRTSSARRRAGRSATATAAASRSSSSRRSSRRCPAPGRSHRGRDGARAPSTTRTCRTRSDGCWFVPRFCENASLPSESRSSRQRFPGLPPPLFDGVTNV